VGVLPERQFTGGPRRRGSFLYGPERDRNDESCFAASSPFVGHNSAAASESVRIQRDRRPATMTEERQRDDQRLTGPGQIFRVAMYHENHPDGSNEMCNLVLAFESPRVISWKPGYR
jgi:hypothetical protein